MSATQDFVRKQQTGDPFTKLVLRVIADYANWETGICYPSIETIAADCEASESTVRRRLQDLQKQGFISVEIKSGRPNVITLLGYAQWFASLPVRSFDRGVPQTGVSTGQGGVSGRQGRGVHGTPEISKEIYNINNIKEDSSTTDEFDRGRVYFQDGNIKLCDSLNLFWLEQFGNQQDDLNLALLQIAAYVQPNNVHGLEKQVSSQLARIVRDRKDRDQRYLKAKNGTVQTSLAKPTTSSGWVKVKTGTDLFNKWLDVAREHNKLGLFNIFSKNGVVVVPEGEPKQAWHEFIKATSKQVSA